MSVLSVLIRTNRSTWNDEKATDRDFHGSESDSDDDDIAIADAAFI